MTDTDVYTNLDTDYLKFVMIWSEIGSEITFALQGLLWK